MRSLGRRLPPARRWLARHALRHPDAALPQYFAELLEGVHGRVVEIGCGCGTLFSYYPAAVHELLGVEPNAWSRGEAAKAASQLAFPVRLLETNEADDSLPVGTNTIDVVVCCETLCSVAEQERILVDVRRILRPGGELRVYEHVLASGRMGQIAQRIVDRMGWPKLLGGCHVSRDTVRVITKVGFEWVSLRRVWYARMLVLWPAGPHIIGRARAPEGAVIK